MAQITEDYVSFETAKLLKEKGFNELCQGFYSEYFDNWQTLRFWSRFKPKSYHTVVNSGYILVPTQQMAMKWLREVHKILILVEYDCPTFSSDIYKMDDIDEHGSAKHISPTFANCKNYEEACEAAIKYCLENLI